MTASAHVEYILFIAVLFVCFYVFSVLLVILIMVIGVVVIGLKNGYSHAPANTKTLTNIQNHVARGLPLKVIAYHILEE